MHRHAQIRRSPILLSIPSLVLAAAIPGAAQDLELAPPPAGAAVHVAIVSHAEEDPIYLDRAFYLGNRALLRSLAETITRRGAAYNFQSDWTFLSAVAKFEGKAAKNIVQWLSEQPRIEVDPHAHESQYNYADVAKLVQDLGVTPSRLVGGFLHDPPINPQGWEQHEDGIFGWQEPTYFWRADVLWGAATAQHQGPDDHGSGLWQPADRFDFTRHDPAQRLVYVGTCGGSGSQEQAIVALLAAIASGQAPADGFYTATITIGQGRLDPGTIAGLGAFIDSMQPHVLAGRLRWVTLSETVALWRSQHGGRAFRYDCDTGQVTIP